MIMKMFFCLAVCFSNAALAAETKPFFPGITHDSVIQVFRMLFPDLQRVHCEDDSFGKSCKYEDEEASVYVFLEKKAKFIGYIQNFLDVSSLTPKQFRIYGLQSFSHCEHRMKIGRKYKHI